LLIIQKIRRSKVSPYLLNKQKMLSAGQLTTSSKEAKYIVNADYRSIKVP
jgi:hypothetical protein